MQKTVLLISQNPDDKAFVSQVAKNLNLKFDWVQILDHEAISKVDSRIVAVFADIRPDGNLKDFETSLENKIQKNFVHALVNPKELTNLDAVFLSPAVGHVVIRRFDDLNQGAAIYSRIVDATIKNKFAGVHTLLPDLNATQIKLENTNQRHSTVDVVSHHLKDVGCEDLMANYTATAVDELLTNALYDAKAEHLGRPIDLLSFASSDVALDPKSAIEVFYGISDQYLAVTVIDHMGSLNRAKVLRHIAKGYSGMQNLGNRVTTGGAGVGLAMISRSGGSLFFACQPGVRTEVTVFYRLTNRLSEFRAQFQFVSTQLLD